MTIMNFFKTEVPTICGTKRNKKAPASIFVAEFAIYNHECLCKNRKTNFIVESKPIFPELFIFQLRSCPTLSSARSPQCGQGCACA